ncbi:hypothetical protein CDAR_597021 [Caerostris darwini]|uniref:Uncharacterized protein n=1 Tax=Caerostris darwini TaxID=1538125 RepID=A0AAV4U2G7_9ARAC|nr:hypothetical protein CDAR_597021 [Caerostris darwini]
MVVNKFNFSCKGSQFTTPKANIYLSSPETGTINVTEAGSKVLLVLGSRTGVSSGLLEGEEDTLLEDDYLPKVFSFCSSGRMGIKGGKDARDQRSL